VFSPTIVRWFEFYETIYLLFYDFNF
jgi:hypothetical protein